MTNSEEAGSGSVGTKVANRLVEETRSVQGIGSPLRLKPKESIVTVSGCTSPSKRTTEWRVTFTIRAPGAGASSRTRRVG